MRHAVTLMTRKGLPWLAARPRPPPLRMRGMRRVLLGPAGLRTLMPGPRRRAFGRHQVPSIADDLHSLLARLGQDLVGLAPRTAERLVGLPASIGDRLVGSHLGEQKHPRCRVHLDLSLEHCSGTARTGVEPKPEEELGQLPAGKGIEFSLPLLLIPSAALKRKAIGGSTDQSRGHPRKPVHKFTDQHRNENRGEYEDDDGHRPTPHPGWRAGPNPSRRSRPLSPG